MKHILYILITYTLISACNYKFRKQYLFIPYNQRSIAVEAIYDIGESVVPYEVFWEALQKQVALSGNFKLRSRADADLYLRAMIMKSSTSQYQSDPQQTSEKDRNPNILLDDKTGKPRVSSKYLNLRKASIYSEKTKISLTVNVELWNLHNRQRVFSRNYPLTKNFNMFNQRARIESHFIRNEEQLESHYKSLSQQLAKKVVNDILDLYLVID